MIHPACRPACRTLVLLLVACALGAGGCSGKSRTYRADLEGLDGRLTARANLTKERLRCEIDAEEYRVASVTLVTRAGQRIEPTERQRRYPLLFAWPLLWQLYRRGAFR